MASPDSKEIELISQFRLRLTDLKLKGRFNDDHDLLRWIRARNHDLDQAEKMIRESMKWREENDVDNILSWNPPERFLKELPMEFIGYDNENSPVLVLPYGQWDLKKCVELGEKDDFIKYCDQMFEFLVDKMQGKTKPNGDPVTQFVIIVDHKGLAYRTLASVGAVDMCLQTVRRFEANQPETTKAMYQINANMVFSALFALVKPLMGAATVAKMHIFTSDASKWKPALHAHIPLSILPPCYGGTNDKSACDEILAIPVEQLPEDEEEPPFIQVNVPMADKLDICFTVDEGNSTIKWSFTTDKYDIAFAVNCDGKAYIEKNRVDSHVSPQEGSITCDTPGDYIFTFDNTYSRSRVKVLTYRIDVLTPSGRKQILV